MLQPNVTADFSMSVKAYSYIRMSQRSQIKGSSLKRQLEASERKAKELGLELDTSSRDLGVSAYTGKNAKDGALAKFIELCEAGTIEAGSILIVENLDRITRQKPLDALALFTKLLNLGITIHTLSDGQEFTQETVNGDGGASLLFSIITLIRANEESAIKSRRGAAAWRIKRQNLTYKKLTARTPYWLELSEDKTTFHVIEERALIIRRIFKMMYDGLGALVICKTLNQERVPNFTRTLPGGKNPTKGWSTAYVHSLVAKKAVIGVFQPRKNDNGRRVPAGEEVKDYYPAIIDEDLYYRVLAARSKRRLGVPGTGRKTKLHANLFVGLCKCGLCGASMSYRDDAKDQVLQCYGYIGGLCKHSKRFLYKKLEDVILDSIHEINIKKVIPDTKKDELAELNEKILAAHSKSKRSEKRKLDLLRNFEHDEAAKSVIDELTAEIDGLNTALRGYKERQKVLGATDKKLAEHIKDIKKFRELVAATDKDKAYQLRASLSNEIKKVIDRMEFDVDGGIWVATGATGAGYIIADFLEGENTLHDLNREIAEGNKRLKNVN